MISFIPLITTAREVKITTTQSAHTVAGECKGKKGMKMGKTTIGLILQMLLVLLVAWALQEEHWVLGAIGMQVYLLVFTVGKGLCSKSFALVLQMVLAGFAYWAMWA